MDIVLILLAAGNSRRFQGNKLLHHLEGKPMYRYIADEIKKISGGIFSRKIIVTQYPEIMKDMRKEGYLVIENIHSEWGISHSIHLGLESVNEGEAVCFAVCDQPYLKGETLRAFLESWRLSGKGIGCLRYGNDLGNPVIFSSKYREELLKLEGDLGGKRVVKSHMEDVYAFQVEDGRELQDLDVRKALVSPFQVSENVMVKMKRTGAVILAADKNPKRGKNQALTELGSITVIRRLVLTFQQAGASHIVVITGYQSESIQYELADFGVIFIKNEQYQEGELLASAKLGMDFLRDKCDMILVIPACLPAVRKETVRCLMETGEACAVPVFCKKSGYPLLISTELFQVVSDCKDLDEFLDTVRAGQAGLKEVPVEDEGILCGLDQPDRLCGLIELHNQALLHPYLRISIEKERSFFNARTRLLLQLIHETNSVRCACRHMALSYSKAWNMLNELEKELGYMLVARRHGGSSGGKTCLTEDGIRFLEDFQEFEFILRQRAQEEFNRIFKYLL